MRLFLVLDDGSGEASAFALAKDGAEAIEHTKYLLAGDEGDTSELRPVTADTTRNAETRALLSIWEPIALEATKELRADLVERELNGLEALIPAVVRAFERETAKAVAKERAACFEIASARSRWAYSDDRTRGAAEASFEIAAEIEGRSKPSAGSAIGDLFECGGTPRGGAR